MTQETLSVTQAYTGKTLAELPMHNSTDVDAMLSTAKNLHHQGCLPIYERISVLQKLAELVNNEHEAFSKLIANEGGKPIRDARVEVTRAVGGIHIAIREMQHIKGEEIPMDLSVAGAGRKAFTVMEPIGVVVAVSAFNHPLNLAIHQIIPAIATGCPVIIKPASVTPLCCLRLAELIIEAGLPEGWVQVAITNRENSEKLVTIHVWHFLVLLALLKWAGILNQSLHLVRDVHLNMVVLHRLFLIPVKMKVALFLVW